MARFSDYLISFLQINDTQASRQEEGVLFLESSKEWDCGNHLVVELLHRPEGGILVYEAKWSGAVTFSTAPWRTASMDQNIGQ